MKSAVYIFAVVFAFQAGAVELSEFGPLPDKLPTEQTPQTIPCEEVLPALLKFQERNRQHEDGVVAFLTQASEKITGWYEMLFPLEGQVKTLEPGTFDPIRDGGEKMSQIVDYSYDNTALLAQELDRIIVSLRACKISK